MAIGASRLYHVNANCSDLGRSLAFYQALGLTPVVHTRPSRSQPGSAFGLDRVAWDAWVLEGGNGAEGLSLDLLQWTEPPPAGRPPVTPWNPGLHHLVVSVPDLEAQLGAALDAGGSLVGGPLVGDHGGGEATRAAMVRDPDGTAVVLVWGAECRITRVVINTADLGAAVAYYRDLCGLAVVGTWEDVHRPGELYGLDGPVELRVADLVDAGAGFTVSLVQWLTPFASVASDRRARAANELGLFRLAWATDDCARDEARIRATGGVPFAPCGELSVGDDLPLLRVLFWPGPEGECLELIEVTDHSGVLT